MSFLLTMGLGGGNLLLYGMGGPMVPLAPEEPQARRVSPGRGNAGTTLPTYYDLKPTKLRREGDKLVLVYNDWEEELILLGLSGLPFEEYGD